MPTSNLHRLVQTMSLIDQKELEILNTHSTQLTGALGEIIVGITHSLVVERSYSCYTACITLS